MNVNKVLTRDYEKKTLGEHGKNKPNTNPIQSQYKANSRKAKMNTTACITRTYEVIPPRPRRENKPNQTHSPIKKPRILANLPRFCVTARTFRLLIFLYFSLTSHPILPVFNHFHLHQLAFLQVAICFFEVDHKISFASSFTLSAAFFH